MIMAIVLILGGIFVFIAGEIFSSKRHVKLTRMYGCTPTMAIGLYIMFGKYVYFR